MHDHSTSLQILAGRLLLAAWLLSGTAAVGQQLGPPGRRPEGGVAYYVEIAVPWTSLELGDGRDERYQGRLKFWESEGPLYAAATNLVLRNGRGEQVSQPSELTFRLNDKGDAFGGGEALSGGALPPELGYRLISQTDFALLPLRMLFPHKMPTALGSGPAFRAIEHEQYRVQFEQRFSGVEMISRTPLRSYASRTARTFLPSGFELVDYTLTYEDDRDDTVMAGFGIRMLVQHDRPLRDGRPAPSGVHHLSLLRTHQLDWMRETTVIPVRDWNEKYNKWWERLPDQLFAALSEDALGDPFGSPVAFALRALRLLDEPTLHRLASQANARTLSALAPHLIDLPLTYDPSRFQAAWEASLDPVRRLLLASAVAATGEWQPRFVTEAEIALHSRDASTLRAALLLSKMLRRPILNPALAKVVSGTAPEELRILALQALGAAGGQDATDAILAGLDHAPSQRLRAASLKALADLGDDSLETFFDDPAACFGANDPLTGQFELLVEDSQRAGELLYQLSRLARAVRTGATLDALTAFEKAFAGEDSDVPDGMAWAAAEWSCFTGHLSRDLGRQLEDPRFGRLARRLVHAAGRTSAGALLKELNQARGTELSELAVLLGTTKDPRARAALLSLRNSEDEQQSVAGDDGFEALRRQD